MEKTHCYRPVLLVKHSSERQHSPPALTKEGCSRSVVKKENHPESEVMVEWVSSTTDHSQHAAPKEMSDATAIILTDNKPRPRERSEERSCRGKRVHSRTPDRDEFRANWKRLKNKSQDDRWDRSYGRHSHSKRDRSPHHHTITKTLTHIPGLGKHRRAESGVSSSPLLPTPPGARLSFNYRSQLEHRNNGNSSKYDEMREVKVREIRNNSEKISSEDPSQLMETVSENGSTRSTQKEDEINEEQDGQAIPFLPSSRCCTPPPRPAVVEKYWSDAEETEDESGDEKHLLHINSVNIVLCFLKSNLEKYCIDRREVSNQNTSDMTMQTDMEVNSSIKGRFSCPPHTDCGKAWPKAEYSRGHRQAPARREARPSPSEQDNLASATEHSGRSRSCSPLRKRSHRRHRRHRSPSRQRKSSDRRRSSHSSGHRRHSYSRSSSHLGKESSSRNRGSQSSSLHGGCRYSRSPPRRRRRDFHRNSRSGSPLRDRRRVSRELRFPGRHRNSRGERESPPRRDQSPPPPHFSPSHPDRHAPPRARRSQDLESQKSAPSGGPAEPIASLESQESGPGTLMSINNEKNILSRKLLSKLENEQKLPIAFGKGAKKALQPDNFPKWEVSSLTSNIGKQWKETKILSGSSDHFSSTAAEDQEAVASGSGKDQSQREERHHEEGSTSTTIPDRDTHGSASVCRGFVKPETIVISLEDDEPTIDRPEDYLTPSCTMSTLHQPSFMPDTHKLEVLCEASKPSLPRVDCSVSEPSAVTSQLPLVGTAGDSPLYWLSDSENENEIEKVDSTVPQVSSLSTSQEAVPSPESTSVTSDISQLPSGLKSITTMLAKTEEEKALLDLNPAEMSTLLSLIKLAKEQVANGKGVSSSDIDGSTCKTSEPAGHHSGENQHQQPCVPAVSAGRQEKAEKGKNTKTTTCKSSGRNEKTERKNCTKDSTTKCSGEHNKAESENRTKTTSSKGSGMQGKAENIKKAKSTTSKSCSSHDKDKKEKTTNAAASKGSSHRSQTTSNGQHVRHHASWTNKNSAVSKDRKDKDVAEKRTDGSLSRPKGDSKHSSGESKPKGSKTDDKRSQGKKNPGHSSEKNVDQTPSHKKCKEIESSSKNGKGEKEASRMKKTAHKKEPKKQSKSSTKGTQVQNTFISMQSVQVDLSNSHDSNASSRRAKSHKLPWTTTPAKPRKDRLKRVGKRIYIKDSSDSDNDDSLPVIDLKRKLTQDDSQSQDVHPLHQQTIVVDHSVSSCLACKHSLSLDKFTTISLSVGTVTMRCQNCCTYTKMEKVMPPDCFTSTFTPKALSKQGERDKTKRQVKPSESNKQPKKEKKHSSQEVRNVVKEEVKASTREKEGGASNGLDSFLSDVCALPLKSSRNRKKTSADLKSTGDSSDSNTRNKRKHEKSRRKSSSSTKRRHSEDNTSSAHPSKPVHSWKSSSSSKGNMATKSATAVKHNHSKSGATTDAEKKGRNVATKSVTATRIPTPVQSPEPPQESNTHSASTTPSSSSGIGLCVDIKPIREEIFTLLVPASTCAQPISAPEVSTSSSSVSGYISDSHATEGTDVKPFSSITVMAPTESIDVKPFYSITVTAPTENIDVQPFSHIMQTDFIGSIQQTEPEESIDIKPISDIEEMMVHECF